MAGEGAIAGKLLGGLVKPEKFSGKSHEFRQWKFGLVNYLTLLDSSISDALAFVESSPRDVVIAEPTTLEDQKRSSFLFALLASLTGGATQRLLQEVRTRNGLEGWRRLLVEFEPKVASRRLALWTRVLGYQFSQQSDLSWRESYSSWTSLVEELESLGAVVDQDLKVSLVLLHAPSEMQGILQSRATEWEGNFTALTSTILCWLLSRRHFNDEDAMQVDAVQHGLRGGGGGGGRGGGRGGGGGGRGGGAGNGRGQKPDMSKVTCYNCEGTGHFARDCKKEKKKQSGPPKKNDKGKGDRKKPNKVREVQEGDGGEESGGEDHAEEEKVNVLSATPIALDQWVR